jgi:hypothetical protein
MRVTTLSIKNLVTLFGVTPMTVHNWKKGSPQRPALPEQLTPAKVKRWATQNGIEMTCDPSTLLGVGAKKPGPKPKLAAARVPTRPLSKHALDVLKKPRAA